MKPAIEVRGISKCYTINHKNKASYSTLKDDLANLFKRPLGLANHSVDKEEKFWALQDISFDVQQGEIFGIIGRNGSGKSTLLKIMSRIVEPTKGTIHLRGRTASLLEVGTGFHPELTGRENIYFNGSMLGMSRQEIGRKFDEIVDFAEIDKFLDTPVKFYSSGMYVRLAFSVAAHLDPEILILDEVLAVGDVGFQEKSRKKIISTMEKGSTVLFVSHSMPAVQQLCSRGILLNNGHIEYSGATDELVSKYLDIVRSESPVTDVESSWENDGTIDNEHFVPQKIYVTDDKGKKITQLSRNDSDKWINIEANVKQPSDQLTIGVALYTPTKTLLFMTFPTDKPKNDKHILQKKGHTILRAKIPKHTLNAGRYKVSLIGGVHNKFWLFEPGTHTPSIELAIDGGLSDSPYWKNPRDGLMAPLIDWEIE